RGAETLQRSASRRTATRLLRSPVRPLAVGRRIQPSRFAVGQGHNSRLKGSRFDYRQSRLRSAVQEALTFAKDDWKQQQSEFVRERMLEEKADECGASADENVAAGFGFQPPNLCDEVASKDQRVLPGRIGQRCGHDVLAIIVHSCPEVAGLFKHI